MMVVLLAFVGYTGLKNLELATNSAELIGERTLPVVALIKEMEDTADLIFLEAKTIQESPHEPGSVAGKKERIVALEGEFEKSFHEYSEAVSASGSVSGSKDALWGKWKLFDDSAQSIMDYGASGASGPEALVMELEASRSALAIALDDSLDVELAGLGAEQEALRNMVDISLKRIFISVWIFVLLSVTGIITAYSISSSLVRFKDVAEEIGKGNLDARAIVNSGDEIGTLAATFNQMASDLKKSNEGLKSKIIDLTNAKAQMRDMMNELDNANKKLLIAQGQLKKNYRDLKVLDSEKDKFISIAAHELKTPMTAIRGFAQLLESEKTVKNRQRRKKYIRIIDEEIIRLAKLVTDVLDLSRIDLGTINIFPEDVSPEELVEEVRYELLAEARKKKLAITTNIKKNLPKIKTDQEKLKQILINLVGNAIHYTEKGSINIAVSKKGEKILFSVADTGIGIPEKAFKKIFTRFYQVEPTYTRKVGGTGLGLSISKEFVEVLGGKIWFDTCVGKGTTFYFTLPITLKHAKGRNG